MSGDGKFGWYWGHGREPEYMYGPEDTREAILQVARVEGDGDSGFTICEADKSVPSFDIFDASDVMQRYEEHNEECWSEDGFDVSLTSAAERSLEAALAATFEAWAKANDATGNAWAFGTQRNTEYFPPAKPEGQP